MPNQENKQIVESLKDKLTRAKSVVFTDYLGISSKDANDLRQKIKESGAEVVVTKNTLLKVALKEKEQNFPQTDQDLKGSTAAIFAYEDPISPIKVLFDFAKKIEFPKIKSAIIENRYNTAEEVEILKDLPSKEVLLAKALGSMKAPVRGLVSVMGGVQRKFVYALNAIKESKGGAK